MTDNAITGIFREPFTEQVAFFRQKLGNLVPTERWDDMQKEAHDRGFMVAGASKADLLSDLAAAVDTAISQGTSLEAFRKDFKAITARHGWAYKGDFNWRTRVIYQTNMATSYAAGRLAQQREAGFGYLMYRHSDSVAHPRPQHVSWSGLVRPIDDPWWRSHYPPNGWGCQCRTMGVRTPDEAKRFGGRDEEAPDDGIDTKTGEPMGIDKGWGYMPGNTVTDTVRAMASKTVQWEYTLAKAYMQGVPESTRDQLAESYRSLPSTADASRQFAKRIIEGRPNFQEYQTLGLVTSKDVAQIKGMQFATRRGDVLHENVDTAGFDYALDPSSVQHIHKGHGLDDETLRGQRPVAAEDYEKLPLVLNSPDQMEAAGVAKLTQHPLVRFTKEIEGETYVYTVEVRQKRKMLVAQSFWIRE